MTIGTNKRFFLTWRVQVRPWDCNLGKLRRSVSYVYVDDDDEYCYAGKSGGRLGGGAALARVGLRR